MTGPETNPAYVAAVDQGHVLVYDPPWSFTAALRWTCQKCGRAAINYDGNVYGSAVEGRCPERAA